MILEAIARLFRRPTVTPPPSYLRDQPEPNDVKVLPPDRLISLTEYAEMHGARYQLIYNRIQRLGDMPKAAGIKHLPNKQGKLGRPHRIYRLSELDAAHNNAVARMTRGRAR